MSNSTLSTRFKGLAALAIGGLALSGVASEESWAQTGPDRGRPNVLFIAVDDLKPTLGAFGDEHAITPNIDRLAARGTVFLNAHCQQAVSAPSRVSLLTGLRPDQTRVWDLQTRFRDHQPDVITLPQHFRMQGYETVGIGKIYDGRSVDSEATMDEVSWSRPYIRTSAISSSTLGYADPVARQLVSEQLQQAQEQGLTSWQERRRFVQHRPPVECADVPDEAYIDGVNARQAAVLLKELAAGQAPFFLAVGFAKPHLPFNAPKAYWDLYDRATLPMPPTDRMPEGAPAYAFQDSWELRNQYTGVPQQGPLPLEQQAELIHGYYACVSFVDAQIGIVLQALEDSGQADNTIIVLWGDHGFHLGDHGMWCKHTNYEQATRSPLIIAAPMGLIPPSVTSAPVEFIDLYPTLCELAGLEQPGHLQGTSLIPTMRDPEVDVRPFAVSQYPRNPQHLGRVMGYALRDRRYRYVQWRRWDRDAGAGEVVAEELYDLVTDPDETQNVIAQAPNSQLDVLRDYADRMVALSRPSVLKGP